MYINFEGGSLLLLVFLIIIVVEEVQIKRGRAKKHQYDERQELVRGRGFKYAFFVMAVCLILELAYGTEIEQYIVRDIRLCLCLIFGVLADTVYVIWHDGYFPVNEHPLAMILGLVCLLGINLFQTVHAARIGTLVQDGVLTGGAVFLIMTAVWLIELLAILFRYLWKKREKEE